MIYTLHTRPDVATIVSSVSRFNESPQSTHYKAALRVLRYLYCTRDKALVFDPVKFPGRELEIFSDSSWCSCPDTSRSRSGYITFFNRCPISWKSSMQKIVTLSSCETEYVALGEAIKEAMCLKHLLGEINFQQGPVRVYVDNQSAIKLAKNSMVRPHTKHICMRYH